MALTLHSFEKLDGALGALLLAGEFETAADPRAWIRKSNILLDTAIDCGMPRDHDDHVGWAAERVTRFLMSA